MPGSRLLPVSAGRSAFGARSDSPPAGMNAGRMGLRLRAVARRFGGGELRMAALAAVAGVAAGYGAVGFRLAIDGAHFVFFGAGSKGVVEAVRALEWQRLLLAPALGGLGVGLPIHLIVPERRLRAVADVIAARAVRGGKLPLRDGLAQALARTRRRGGRLRRRPDDIVSRRGRGDDDSPGARTGARGAAGRPLRGRFARASHRRRDAGAVARPGAGRGRERVADTGRRCGDRVADGPARRCARPRAGAARRGETGPSGGGLGGRPVGVVRREDALAAHNRALLREHAVTRGRT